jgi:hypothetical protein
MTVPRFNGSSFKKKTQKHPTILCRVPLYWCPLLNSQLLPLMLTDSCASFLKVVGTINKQNTVNPDNLYRDLPFPYNSTPLPLGTVKLEWEDRPTLIENCYEKSSKIAQWRHAEDPPSWRHRAGILKKSS